jgi:Protein of unknown function (DUF3891)
MLVRPEGDGALVIGQLSHAWLSGQLARAWGNEQFGSVEPREEVALGAEQHDIGWALFDLEPRLNPDTGLPRGFLELSLVDYLAIWRGAPDHLYSQSLRAALVVSLHGRSLSELRLANAGEHADELRAHIEEERERQARICETLGVSDEELQRTRRQMWTWDGLSLALCNAWRPFVAKHVPTADGLTNVELSDRDDGTSTLDPWPFADERVEVQCEARRLASRYDNQTAMRDAFDQAKPFALTFTLTAP